MLPSLLPLADPRFEALLDDIGSATTTDGLKEALSKVLDGYGCKHVVYHALLIPHASVSQVALVHTYPDEWIAHYAARRYYAIDPVVLGAQASIMPFDWSSLDKDPPRVRKLFREADDIGIGRQGLTIPIRGANGERALFTITRDCSDAEWERRRVLYLRDMQIIGVYVHQRVLAIHQIDVPPRSVRLSGRERECLLWAAGGKTVDDTGMILALSASAVKGYLDSARTKLNCVSKPQAIGRAVALGLITV